MPDSPPASPWSGGWHRGAQPVACPNFGPRPTGCLIDLIVVHSISLPPGEYGNHNVQRLFTNTLDWDEHPYFNQIRGVEVSAHFFIRRDGVLLQFVDCDARAWHAGKSHFGGRSNRNDDSVGIELEGLEGTVFEAVQYRVLASLCDDLGLRYPIEQIAGHEHIAPGRKHDPGSGFAWPLLGQLLRTKSVNLPVATLR